VVRGRTGNAGLQEGYEAIAYLADLPFTQEFISVKFCRLFVHDGFMHGIYDFTDPNLSAEGQLVRDCMRAWESGSPKGQIREVLKVIFASELFRGHEGSMKVKTPLEFTLSAMRAPGSGRMGPCRRHGWLQPYLAAGSHGRDETLTGGSDGYRKRRRL
jgi:hypothetical protein